jgi:hypothetical protein
MGLTAYFQSMQAPPEQPSDDGPMRFLSRRGLSSLRARVLHCSLSENRDSISPDHSGSHTARTAGASPSGGNAVSSSSIARWPSSWVETWNRDEPDRAGELRVEAVELETSPN